MNTIDIPVSGFCVLGMGNQASHKENYQNSCQPPSSQFHVFLVYGFIDADS